MVWALFMVMIRSTESQFGLASFGPTSPARPVTGSRLTRQTAARLGRPIGYRTFEGHLRWRAQIKVSGDCNFDRSRRRDAVARRKRNGGRQEYWGTWNCLNEKTNRSASETDGMHRPAGAGRDSSHAVTRYVRIPAAN